MLGFSFNSSLLSEKLVLLTLRLIRTSTRHMCPLQRHSSLMIYHVRRDNKIVNFFLSGIPFSLSCNFLRSRFRFKIGITYFSQLRSFILHQQHPTSQLEMRDALGGVEGKLTPRTSKRRRLSNSPVQYYCCLYTMIICFENTSTLTFVTDFCYTPTDIRLTSAMLLLWNK